MKTKNNSLVFTGIVLSLLCIILYACEGETIDPGKSGTPLQLNAEIGGLKTRVSGSSWEKNDAIGVYMQKEGQPLNASSLRQNVKYETTGTDEFKPAKDVEEIILPFDESNVDLISYYPHRENISNFTYPVDVSNQSVQTNIDLMYSNNAKKVNSKNPSVQMQFSHQLSKVIMNIVKDASINLKNLSVIISNAPTQGSFDLNTANLTIGSKRENIQLSVSGEGTVVEAILLPEADLSGMDLWFVMDEEGNEAYKLPLKETIGLNSFEKATKYTYNVTLFNKKTVLVTESSITAWIDKPSVDVIVDRTADTPPIIKGSKKDPYSVIEAKSQDNQGKVGVWVEGFIVGSFDGTINKFVPGVAGAVATNIALADTPDESDTGKMIPVQLPSSGAIRDALNIPAHPENINKKVMIRGDLGNYYSAPGLRDTKEYAFIDPDL